LVYHYATNYEEYHLVKSNQGEEEDARDLLADDDVHAMGCICPRPRCRLHPLQQALDQIKYSEEVDAVKLTISPRSPFIIEVNFQKLDDGKLVSARMEVLTIDVDEQSLADLLARKDRGWQLVHNQMKEEGCPRTIVIGSSEKEKWQKVKEASD